MAFQTPFVPGRARIAALARTPALCPRPRPTHPRAAPHHASPTACTASESASQAPQVPAKSTDDDMTPPPNTFYQAISQAQDAVDAAIAASYTLLEVEFPPLPTSQLESSAVGAYEVSDANVRLAVDFAKRYTEQGRKVVISFPDRIERDRALDFVSETELLQLRSLRNSRPGLLIERLWTTPEIELAVEDDDDMYIVLGASCQELPDVENLVKDAASSKPVILFNLKLDTSRGDLGLPAFPRRDMHYRFLCKILPVYYLRTRTYSRSITKPPYVVNYSGALYRVYPGPYQVLLDTTGGNYRRLCTLDKRPALGEVRDILTEGMSLSENSDNSMMFRGYKSRTWWEEDETKAQSNEWRS